MVTKSITDGEKPPSPPSTSAFDLIRRAREQNPNGLVAVNVATNIHEHGYSAVHVKSEGKATFANNVAQQDVVLHEGSCQRFIVETDPSNPGFAFNNVAGGNVVQEGQVMSTFANPVRSYSTGSDAGTEAGTVVTQVEGEHENVNSGEMDKTSENKGCLCCLKRTMTECLGIIFGNLTSLTVFECCNCSVIKT